MVQKEPGFRDYFHALMPGGAGWVMGDFSPLKGKPIYAFIGAQDTRAAMFSEIEPAAKKAGADVTFLKYDAGHAMPTQDHSMPRRRSLADHSKLAALAAVPRIFLAPLLRCGPKRPRHCSNKPSTNARLPTAAPSVKYLTFHRSI